MCIKKLKKQAGYRPLAPRPVGVLRAPNVIVRSVKAARLFFVQHYSWKLSWEIAGGLYV